MTSLEPLLATLINRWQEVVDAYKPEDMSGEWDDTTRRYQHYRHTYQRAIRDLRHVLDKGTVPCDLWTVEERRSGDCGHSHDADADRSRSTVAKPLTQQVSDFQTVTSVVSSHIAEALLNSKSDEVRSWALALVNELQCERINLRDEIGSHLVRKALGNPGGELPF